MRDVIVHTLSTHFECTLSTHFEYTLSTQSVCTYCIFKYALSTAALIKQVFLPGQMFRNHTRINEKLIISGTDARCATR
jgi:hypothetical protein